MVFFSIKNNFLTLTMHLSSKRIIENVCSLENWSITISKAGACSAQLLTFDVTNINARIILGLTGGKEQGLLTWRNLNLKHPMNNKCIKKAIMNMEMFLAVICC